MWIKGVFLAFISGSFGLLAAAGVFTVLVAVGLVPRFAGKTHTSGQIIFYEEMVIFGTMAGAASSLFEDSFGWGQTGMSCGNLFLVAYGLFSGMFTGCLALAIAEMLDSIPIFSRRIGFKRGISTAITAMAAGKVCGSLFYFIKELYQTAQ